MKEEILTEGFTIIENVLTGSEINDLSETIIHADSSKSTFRKTKDIFAIRQFFREIPEAFDIVFNKNLCSIISEISADGYFVVKAIYFDKPADSNWFVAYHQDLTISVDKRVEAEGYGPWTRKQNQFSVQPPRSILEDNFTIRLHLDDQQQQMVKVIRTNSDNQDFQKLVKELDTDLAIRDGAAHEFYAQFNKLNRIKNVVLVYEQETAVGCGGMKEYEKDIMEIKRMYVAPVKRGKGIATAMIRELEKWAMELQYSKCILETGRNQPEAIALYLKNKYTIIKNYGQYAEIENSVCFEKFLTDQDYIQNG